jgi:hypothetical protein
VALFAVFRATAFTNAYNGLFGFYTTNFVASYSLLIKSNAKSAIYASASPLVNYDGNGNVTYSTATTHVFSATIANSSIQSFGDGSSDGNVSSAFTLVTTPPSALAGMNIGSDPLLNRFTQWQIGEAIIVSGAAITQDNRQRTEGYLARKWGSRSRLPNGHPYK